MMKYKYKIEYTGFVLLLCAGLGWTLNLEFDRVAFNEAGSKTTVHSTTRKIIHLIAPAQFEVGAIPTSQPSQPENSVSATTADQNNNSAPTVDLTSSSASGGTQGTSTTPPTSGKERPKGRHGPSILP